MTFQSGEIKIGVSACLLGENVRYDGSHKSNQYIIESMGKYLELIPFCPEKEAGMGVPREPVRLVGKINAPRMMGLKSDKDWTRRLSSASVRHTRQLKNLNISGYILKSDSPSCGVRNVKLFPTKSSKANHKGQGLFAGELIAAIPWLPVADERAFDDIKLRDNFVVRIFAYKRLQELFGAGYTRGAVIKFHETHKYLLMAHSPKYYKILGQLVTHIGDYKSKEFKANYSELFMRALSYKSTVKKNAKVLLHIYGYLKDIISKNNNDLIQKSINSYRLEKAPLTIPIALINSQILSHKIECLRNQLYLNPHPKELKLRYDS